MANILENKAQLEANNTSLRDQVLSKIRELPDYVEPVEYNEYTGENPLTVGEEGASIPENTLLTNTLQIQCGVSPGLTAEMFGCTKMAIDTFTFSTTTAPGYAFNHTLGEIPQFAILITNATWEELAETYAIAKAVLVNAPIKANDMYGKGRVLSYRGGSTSGALMISAETTSYLMTVTNTQVQFDNTTSISGSSLRFAPVQYTLITMA